MKTLVVYYSLEGNTKFIAEGIKDSINADIVQLKLKKELNKLQISNRVKVVGEAKRLKLI